MSGLKRVRHVRNAMVHDDSDEVTYMINWLIENHYLRQTKGQYPVLHLTSDTAKFNDKVTLAQLNKLKTTLERIYRSE